MFNRLGHRALRATPPSPNPECDWLFSCMTNSRFFFWLKSSAALSGSDGSGLGRELVWLLRSGYVVRVLTEPAGWGGAGSGSEAEGRKTDRYWSGWQWSVG